MRGKPFSFIILFLLIISISGCASCQSKPDPKDYSCQECYKEADCYYRHQNKNDNKSDCASWGMDCRAAMRYDYCKDKTKRDPSHDFEKCWGYRNQK